MPIKKSLSTSIFLVFLLFTTTLVRANVQLSKLISSNMVLQRNAGRAYEYRKLFPNMIQDRRKHFDQGDLPLLFVQLANFQQAKKHPDESEWTELREAQSMTLDNAPNTGMAVIIDIGDADDIHPKKQTRCW
ncbi:Sialic acid-specific 9-O-acetylesterase [hydrothermal vent metagenome]|uniref:Sialic acid-specific 9-O-acetylesterase n=1 Tax=hydrothermal vent metagenome TaxID=652676 RepID=A0A3B0TR13_9ZZZZ